MNNPTDPKTVDEIETWRIQETCRAILGSSLVESDSHDVEEGQEHQPLMTEDGAWYFVPHYDGVRYPSGWIGEVGRRRSCGRPRAPVWGVETIVTEPATRWDPESSDIVELAREDNLTAAFCAVRRLLLDQELSDIALGVHAQYEMKMAPFIEQYMTPTET